ARRARNRKASRRDSTPSRVQSPVRRDASRYASEDRNPRDQLLVSPAPGGLGYSDRRRLRHAQPPLARQPAKRARTVGVRVHTWTGERFSKGLYLILRSRRGRHNFVQLLPSTPGRPRTSDL